MAVAVGHKAVDHKAVDHKVVDHKEALDHRRAVGHTRTVGRGVAGRIPADRVPARDSSRMIHR